MRNRKKILNFMKIVLYFFLIAVMALGVANNALAKEERLPVSVNATADDMVGRSLVYKIKEELRRSASMRLVDTDEKGVQLVIVTLPRDSDNPSLSTVYSAVWTLEYGDVYPAYIKSQVGYCGRDAVDSSAVTLVANTDKVYEDFKSMIKAAEEFKQKKTAK